VPDECLARWRSWRGELEPDALVAVLVAFGSPPSCEPVDDVESLTAEAIRTWLAELLDELAADDNLTVSDVLDRALRRWATAMADRYNAGYHWPHPIPRRPFPPPLVHP
jgi:hypothetical protein